MKPRPRQSQENRTSDYGYCNARVRGMWAQLLAGEALEQLVAAPNIEAQVRMLYDTPYRGELEDSLLHGVTVSAIDEALRHNMGRTWANLRQMLPKRGVGLVTAVIARWDVFDLKTIIRGVHAGSTPEEIVDSLLPAATLTNAELDELARAESVAAVIDILGTWRMPFSRPLDAARQAFQQTGELAVLEMSLDRWFFSAVAERLEHGRSQERRIVRRLVGTMVDVENMRTVFRLAGARLDQEAVDSYFLVGGAQIDGAMFRMLAAADEVDDVIDAVSHTPYARRLNEAAQTYLHEGTLSVLERALEDLLTREMLAARRPDPLCIGVPLAFLWAKQNEVSNIRIAVTGRSVGLPAERMKRELILV